MDNPVAQSMVAAVRKFVERAEAAIAARIDALEARVHTIPAGPKGDPGESIKGDPGKDGAPGRDAEPIHPDTVALMVRDAVAKAVAALPVAKDGAPGRDAVELIPLPGIDEGRSYPAGTYALHNGGEILSLRRTDPIKNGDLLTAGWRVSREGIAALVITQGENPRELTVAAMLTSGTKAISEFRLPAMIYRGVFVEGKRYEQGDCVSWGAHQWHCNEPTTEKPIEGGKAWTLSVKRGRDGKEGPPGPKWTPPAPVKLDGTKK